VSFLQAGALRQLPRANPQATAVGGIFGYSHTAGGYDGGQAEYVRVPYADFGPMIIPDWMDPDDAVLLTDVVPTGYQAAEMGGDQARRYGLRLSARARSGSWPRAAPGCSAPVRVIVIDHLDYRLEFVKNYAPAEVYNFRELDDLVVFMKKTTDGLGADVCIDAVGNDASGNVWQTIIGKKMKLEAGSAIALHWAINSVKKGGVVSIVGVYGPTGNLVPMGNVVNKGLTLRANQASVKRLLPRLIEHVKAGHINPKAMITHRVPLEDISDAYHIFSAKLDGCIKPVLVPNAA
jgi:threonine dehydrogenase-like Zn-dependent dehydrogenase